MINKVQRQAAISLLFLFGLFCAEAFAGSGADEGLTLQGPVTVNTSSIVYHPNNVVSLWVKIVPDRNSRTLLGIIKNLREKGKDYRSYEYSGFLSEIDCENARHREISIIHYNKDKNIIDFVNKTNALWQPIDPEKGFHMLHMAFCPAGEKRMYGRASD